MFEWATGLAFSKKHNVPVVFCTLPGVTSRMSEFKTSEKFEVRSSERVQLSLSRVARLLRKVNLEKGITNSQTEQGLNFQDLIFGESRNYHGYFQSWRYFHTLRDLLISEFDLKSPSSSYFELKESLPKRFTGIHIRRGGSGAAVLTTDYHGLLDAEYYKRGIALNARLGGSNQYVVFTDNPERAKETIDSLNLENTRIIGPQDTHSQCENLLLMAQASSFIGANSSYSWWAAYLNGKLETQPIFPRQWYMNPDLSNNDMLLPDWISIGFDKFLNEEIGRGVRLE
jgi:hypothetical protein